MRSADTCASFPYHLLWHLVLNLKALCIKTFTPNNLDLSAKITTTEYKIRVYNVHSLGKLFYFFKKRQSRTTKQPTNYIKPTLT